MFKEEVFAIVGAAIEVHRELGPGFLEAVYQEALEIELRECDIPFEAQKPLRISYTEGRRTHQFWQPRQVGMEAVCKIFLFFFSPPLSTHL